MEKVVILHCADGIEYIGRLDFYIDEESSFETQVGFELSANYIILKDCYGIAPHPKKMATINIFPASMGDNKEMVFATSGIVFITKPYNNVLEIYTKTLERLKEGRTPKLTLTE